MVLTSAFQAHLFDLRAAGSTEGSEYDHDFFRESVCMQFAEQALEGKAVSKGAVTGASPPPVTPATQ